MHKFDAEENKEESEGSIYKIKKGRESLEKKLSSLRDNKNTVINELNSEEEKEDGEESKNINNEGEGSEPSSEDKDSDYFSDENEESKDVVPDLENIHKNSKFYNFGWRKFIVF